MERRAGRVWRRLLDAFTLFSFLFNVVLLLTLLLSVNPLLRLKSAFVEPLLEDLDRAFEGLGNTTIETAVEIDQPLAIRFDLPLDQPMDLDFDLAIGQETVVTLTEPVPLRELPARFTLPGGGGLINGTVTLTLPAGMRLPVRLDMVVPVEETIPVRMTVPVSQTIPVRMSIPVSIQLGEAGLDPAVEQLRAVFAPVREAVERLPDGLRVVR